MVDKQPILQPLSMIRQILEITQGMLEESKNQLEIMKEAKEKTYVLDDEIVDRALKLYKEQNENAKIFINQCKIWKQEKLTELQVIQIQEIEYSTNLLIETNNELLSIFNYCKDRTINKIVEKDDPELALDFLTGKITLPK